jgi:hypothetical protein
MNERNLTAGMAALILALIVALGLGLLGCVNPTGGGAAGIPASGGEPADGTAAVVPAGGGAAAGVSATGVSLDEFTITLGIGGGSRAAAGPGAGTIRYGKILNTAQVIVADAEGNVVYFAQDRRANNSDNDIEISAKVQAGETYHFLVLMGHTERNYSGEEPDNEYQYQDAAPTLLAAGFTTAAVTGDGQAITIAMKPLVVDTVFSYSGVTAPAALPDGVRLPQGVAAAVTWKLTNGLTPLINAQKAVRSGAGDKLGAVKITTTVRKNTNTNDDVTANNVLLSGADDNEISAAVSTAAAVSAGSAYFNLTYAPFNLTDGSVWTGKSFNVTNVKVDASGVPQWIIRNGINNDAQNGDTAFANPTATISGDSLWSNGGEERERGRTL